jgi:hypothetical protein
MELLDISLKIKDLETPIDNIEGNLSFQKPFLMVNNFNMQMGASNINMEGYFKNPLTFFNEKQLMLFGDLKMDTLLVNEFLKEENSTEPVTSAATESDKSLSEMIFANLNTDIGYLVYDNFKLENIHGGVRYYQKQLFLNDMVFNTLGGTVGVTGIAKANLFTGYTVDADVTLDNIDITELFTVFDDFDQDALKSNQIKGKISANTSVSFRMNDNFDVNISTISVDAPTKIIDGELIDFLPMVKLAGFVKVGNFQHMIFDTLESHLFIQKQVIHIPETRVNSNTFDMTISGTHTFENMVDYEVALNMKKLFMEENAITDKTFNFYAMEPSGGITLYLLVKGDIEDPEITYNMGALGGKLGEGLKNESAALKKARDKEKMLKEMRRDSLTKVHRKNQRIRRRNSLKEGWSDLQNK